MVYEIRICGYCILYHAFLAWSIALTKLSALLAEIEKTGEKVLICRHGKPVADLVPHRKRSRLQPHPVMRNVHIDYDPTEPLTEDEWPENSR